MWAFATCGALAVMHVDDNSINAMMDFGPVVTCTACAVFHDMMSDQDAAALQVQLYQAEADRCPSCFCM